MVVFRLLGPEDKNGLFPCPHYYQGTYLGNWKDGKRGLWGVEEEFDFQCLSYVAVIVELQEHQLGSDVTFQPPL